MNEIQHLMNGCIKCIYPLITQSYYYFIKNFKYIFFRIKIHICRSLFSWGLHLEVICHRQGQKGQKEEHNCLSWQLWSATFRCLFSVFFWLRYYLISMFLFKFILFFVFSSFKLLSNKILFLIFNHNYL